jgi:hypothetical protein
MTVNTKTLVELTATTPDALSGSVQGSYPFIIIIIIWIATIVVESSYCEKNPPKRLITVNILGHYKVHIIILYTHPLPPHDL